MSSNKEFYPKIDKPVMLDLGVITNLSLIRVAFHNHALQSGWTLEEFDTVRDFLIDKTFEEQLDIIHHYCVAPPIEADSVTAEDIRFMLEHLGMCMHYLGSKPLATWDEYDRSNYQGLKQKATSRIVRKYAYFSRDVQEYEKYAVDSPPAMYYNSREEAETKLNQETLRTINIYALWVKE